jgi:hypothetical protein
MLSVLREMCHLELAYSGPLMSANPPLHSSCRPRQDGGVECICCGLGFGNQGLAEAAPACGWNRWPLYPTIVVAQLSPTLVYPAPIPHTVAWNAGHCPDAHAQMHTPSRACPAAPSAYISQCVKCAILVVNDCSILPTLLLDLGWRLTGLGRQLVHRTSLQKERWKG